MNNSAILICPNSTVSQIKIFFTHLLKWFVRQEVLDPEEINQKYRILDEGDLDDVDVGPASTLPHLNLTILLVWVLIFFLFQFFILFRTGAFVWHQPRSSPMPIISHSTQVGRPSRTT